MKRIALWLVFLPLQALLLMIFLLADLLRWCALPFRKSPTPLSPVEKRLCSIVVLSWNGRHLLQESIPALLRAVEADGRDHQVLVVDGGSEDGTVEWLHQFYPRVDVLALPENLGFGPGNNRGVEVAKNDIVVLLNNDMIVAPDFLAPLLKGFDHPDVFAVSSQIEFPEGKRREETGQTQGAFRLGYLHLSHGAIDEHHFTRGLVPVLWAGGGSSAFRRDCFLELGGFSHLYDPCYMEDTDLSYRAWRRGWKCFIAAESRVLHKHRSTTAARFTPQQLRGMIEQRRLWHTWSNFQFRTLVRHLLLVPLNLTKWLTVGDYLRAFRKLLPALVSRMSEPARKLGDRQILEWSSRPYLYFLDHPSPVSDSQDRQRLRILILSAYLPHLGTHGGAGRVYQLMRRVASRHDITLLSFVEDEKDASFEGQARAVCRRVETVLRRGFKPLSPFVYEPFEEFNVEAFRSALEKTLCRQDFDAIHFEWAQMALYRDLLPKLPTLLTEIEVNYAAHRTLVEVAEKPFERMRLRYNTLQTLYRELEACRGVDRVVCVTEEDKGYLEGYLPSEQLEVVNTGVDTGYFHFNMGGFEPGSMVFVGAFRHSPNVDAMKFFFEMIFPRILKRQPKAHLYIVGSKPPEKILEMGEHPNCTVTGFVDDIREYYRRAQVVVVPLRTGVGIRGKILEAWSAGRPVVATRLACQGLVIAQGENIIVSDEPEEFADWTAALLQDPGACRRLGLQGRITVEQHYDWDMLGEKMAGVYEEVVAEHRARNGAPGRTGR